MRADADSLHIPRYRSGRKCFWIIPVFANRAFNTVHVVKTANVYPHNCLSSLNFESRRSVLIIGRFYDDAFDTAGIVLGNQLVPKKEGH